MLHNEGIADPLPIVFGPRVGSEWTPRSWTRSQDLSFTSFYIAWWLREKLNHSQCNRPFITHLCQYLTWQALFWRLRIFLQECQDTDSSQIFSVGDLLQEQMRPYGCTFQIAVKLKKRFKTFQTCVPISIFWNMNIRNAASLFVPVHLQSSHGIPKHRKSSLMVSYQFFFGFPFSFSLQRPRSSLVWLFYPCPY